MQCILVIFLVTILCCLFDSKKHTVCHLSQQEAVERAKLQLGIVFLELDWEDTTSFIISDADLTKCVKFIHSAITSGGSVLVHCAQVGLHVSHVHANVASPLYACKVLYSKA